VKFIIAICCSLFALVAVNSAAAGPLEQEVRFRPLIQVPAPRPDPPQRTASPVPPRDLRGSGEADRNRMSPDERQQLRRDIQGAGKDIYHRDRQTSGGQQRK
jgi:hypothetical protein